jgi:hypothetical protein
MLTMKWDRNGVRGPMDAHSSGVAFGRRERETDSISALESLARDFEALVIVLERCQSRYGDEPNLSLDAARRAAERGLALCNQPLGRAGRE